MIQYMYEEILHKIKLNTSIRIDAFKSGERHLTPKGIRCLYYLEIKVIIMNSKIMIIMKCDSSRLVIYLAPFYNFEIIESI